MRSFLCRFAYLCVFLASTSAFAVPKAPAKVTPANPQIDPKKYNVCSITINSPHEINAFKKVLGTKKFNFIELTTLEPTEKEQEEAEQDEKHSSVEPDYLDLSCKRQIRCDILVISGHFGGKFFGDSGRDLDLDDLELASCKDGCRMTIQAPKEVFLFGCNTLAGKNADFRTPEQYREALLSHGNDFTPETAEQMVAFRYSSFGDSFAERMAGVFKNTPRIYGFDSIAPQGKNVEAMLLDYLRKAEKDGYYSQGKFLNAGSSINTLLKNSLRQTTIAQSVGLGEQKYRSALCYLKDPKIPARDKFKFVEQSLTGPGMLASLPVINKYLADFNRGHDSGGYKDGEWDDKTYEYFENPARFAKAKRVMDEMIDKNFDAIISMQMSALKFQRMMGWITEDRFLNRSRQLLIGDNSTKWTRARVDTVRSILPYELKIKSVDQLPSAKLTDPLFLSVMSQIALDDEAAIAKFIEISENTSLPMESRDNALKSILQSQERDSAVNYVKQLIARRGPNGLMRLAQMFAGFWQGKHSNDVFEIIAKVIQDDSAPTIERFYAIKIGMSGKDIYTQLKAEDLFRKVLADYGRSGELAGFTPALLCLNVSTFMQRRGDLVLDRQEQEAIVKMALSCGDSGGGLMGQLIQGKNLDNEVLDSIFSYSISKNHWNGGLEQKSDGFYLGYRLVDFTKLPKSAAIALERFKKNPQAASGLTFFALGLPEGQKILAEYAMQGPANQRVGWAMIASPYVAPKYREQLIEHLLKESKFINKEYLMRAIMLQPSLASQYLQFALNEKGGLSVALRKEEMKSIGEKLADENILNTTIKLLRSEEDSFRRESLASVIAMSRPKSELQVEKMRRLACGDKDPLVRGAALMSLIVVGVEPLTFETVAQIQFDFVYTFLMMHMDRERLKEIALKELDTPKGIRALTFLISYGDEKSDYSKVAAQKFFDYQVRHHTPAKDLSDNEIGAMNIVMRVLGRDKTRILESWISEGGKPSIQDMKLAFSYGSESVETPRLRKIMIDFIANASVEDLNNLTQNFYLDGDFSGAVNDAIVERFVHVRTVSEMNVLARFVDYKKMNLKQRIKIREFGKQIKDRNMKDEFSRVCKLDDY